MFEKFNATQTTNRLSLLDNRRQLAFGASVCMGVLPNYLRFQLEKGWGNHAALSRIIEDVWMLLQDGDDIKNELIIKMIENCERAAPSSEKFNSIFVTAAQDACFSLCALLDYLIKPDTKRITQIATYATDSVDLYIQELEMLQSDDPGLEGKIIAHPLMQQELQRQEDIVVNIENIKRWEAANFMELRHIAVRGGRGNLELS